MAYYLYRLKDEEFQKQTDREKIPITLVKELDGKSEYLVFVSKGMKILGHYRKNDKTLEAVQLAKKDIKIQDFYGKISIVTFVGERTYKIFAKPLKEITKADFETITGAFG